MPPVGGSRRPTRGELPGGRRPDTFDVDRMSEADDATRSAGCMMRRAGTIPGASWTRRGTWADGRLRDMVVVPNQSLGVPSGTAPVLVL